MVDMVEIEGVSYETNKRDMWEARGRENFAHKNWRIRPVEYSAIAQRTTGPVIEIGCAFGFLARFLPESTEYLGVDWSQFMIEKARQFHPTRQFIVADAFDLLPDYADHFSTVIALQWLEHYVEAESCIELVRQLGRDRLIAGVPRGLGHNVCHVRAWPNEKSFKAWLSQFGKVEMFAGAPEHVCGVLTW